MESASIAAVETTGWKNPESIKLVVHPGIGDLSWVYSKIVNAGRPIKLVIAQDAKFQRAIPYVKILPNVVHARYGTTEDYVPLRQCGNAYWWQYEQAYDNDVPCYLTANNYLEHGNRLEGFLPDLETSFHYDLDIPEQDKEFAKNVFMHGFGAGGMFRMPHLYIGVYTSSLLGTSLWKGWSAREWLEFCEITTRLYSDACFVLLGAKYDGDATELLARRLRKEGIQHINLCGQTTVGAAIEVIRRCNLFVSYASGLSIMADVVKTPSLMFYPKTLAGLMDTWADPISIATNRYQGMLWPRPIDAVARIDRIENLT